MFHPDVKTKLQDTLAEIKEAGLFKEERLIQTPQSAHIKVRGQQVLNFCANNYLGLSSHADLIAAAHQGIERYGYGLSSVRFICGTQTIHKDLEHDISAFLKTEDTILYTSCFDANGGLFETLLDDKSAIISDALNHASIIDGIRLCKAERFRYANCDMNELESHLKATQKHNMRLIATDGVFSMDGFIAPLKEVCDLAEKYNAMVMVDDSHATGFVGKTGRGTPEHCGVEGRIDVMTSTLGKALGGASGGFTTGRKEIIELLRQRSRPYLFSNTLAPALVVASLKALQLLSQSTDLRDKLERNTAFFRKAIAEAGFEIKPGIHPIVPVMLGDAKLAQAMARDLLLEGVYVIGFFYPVVPKGQARIRVQISAGHSQADLEKAVEAFRKVGKKHNVI